MEDRYTITCIQCGREFEFSADEQIIYERRGFDAPARCPECRKRKSKKITPPPAHKGRTKKKHYKTRYETDY